MTVKSKKSLSIVLLLCMLLTVLAPQLNVYAAGASGLSNRVYYSQLKDAEKKIYNDLDAVALSYFKDKTNATEVSINGKTCYRTTGVTCPASFSEADVKNIVSYYLWENPIYYFLMDDCYYVANADGTKEVAFLIYPMFKDGSSRSQITTNVINKINSLNASVKSKGSDYDRAKAVHDMILSNTTMNKDLESKYMSGTDYDDSSILSKSVYSTLMLGTGNSIGYAKMFYLMSSMAGLPALCVTSDNHAWNLVQVGSKFYQVDAAWDDMSSDNHYKFFLVSGATMVENDVAKCHVVAEKWRRFTYPATGDNYSSGSSSSKSDSSSTTSEKVTVQKLKNTSKGVKITWEDIDDIDELKEYRIQRKTSSSDWKTIKKTYDTTYTDKSVKNGKTYKYRITAVRYGDTKTAYGKAKSIKVKGKK